MNLKKKDNVVVGKCDRQEFYTMMKFSITISGTNLHHETLNNPEQSCISTSKF